MMVVPYDRSYAYIMFEIGKYFIDPSSVVNNVAVKVLPLTLIEATEMDFPGWNM